MNQTTLKFTSIHVPIQFCFVFDNFRTVGGGGGEELIVMNDDVMAKVTL